MTWKLADDPIKRYQRLVASPQPPAQLTVDALECAIKERPENDSEQTALARHIAQHIRSTFTDTIGVCRRS